MWTHDHPGWRQRNFVLPLNLALPPGAPPDAFASVGGVMESRGAFRYDQLSPMCAVHHIVAGRGTFEIDGRTWSGAAGDVVCFFPGQFIHYYDAPGQPWRYYWWRLEGARPEWTLAFAGLSRRTPRLRPADDRAVRLFEQLDARLAQGGCSPHEPISWAWAMLAALAGRGVQPAGDLAAAAHALIESEYDAGLTIEELAARLHVDRTTLFRHFRARYGQSPKAHLEALRLRKAQYLLRSTRRGLKDLAFACGYSDADYFVRRFRLAFGLAPGRWRAQQAAAAARDA